MLFFALLLSLSGKTQGHDKIAAGIPVKNSAGTFYEFPWAGGMNSVQYGQIDLDMDGKKDLLVFDRTGNRIMPFLNAGGDGEINYKYAPSFAGFFPDIFDWMILADYDLDGKEDIFTYSPGYAGMMVYHNTSQSHLEFTRIEYPYLTSFQGGGYTNILVTYADYPGIADIDGDGDLDILTFWGLGSFVEMHKNLSFEKYGHYDSLDYEKTTLCWGYFAESEESNELFLDTCVGWRPLPGDEVLLPHTGSTFLLTDLQGDQVMDVILGDVDYPNLVALENTGTRDSAYIGSYDPHFPSYNRNIELFSMPLAASLDIDNDGREDLLVSPFDPNPFNSENKFSSWFYRNEGNSSAPEYVFDRPDFLQSGMIDVGAGAYPVLADYNGDGLLDLFIGNFGVFDTAYLDQYLILRTEHIGQIALFQNIGTDLQPAFTFITYDFGGLSGIEKMGLLPAFGDLDGDGDLDMLLGNEDGTIGLYENKSGPGQPMAPELVTSDFENIDVGYYSAPQLFDLDGDGLLDLLIGERGGNINFYKGEQGSPWMEFTLVTDSLGKVNVTDPDVSLYGFSVPFFFQDNTGNTLLLTGSEQGELYFYNGIDGNLGGSFSLSDTLGEMIGVPGLRTDRGYRTSACLADLDRDGMPELIVGNFSGGLEYFSVATAPIVSGIKESTGEEAILTLYPNPAKDNITIRADGPGKPTILQVRLFNAFGQLCLSRQEIIRGEASLHVGALPRGIYMVNISVKLKDGGRVFFNKKLTLF